jgi:5-oxoprolinase (ATP-hydrolysing) subunit C
VTGAGRGAVLRVINPGALATLQDRGRMGYQRYGVPQSGAMDMLSFAIACMLVGNPLDEAAIEFTLMGGSYTLETGSCRAAVAGAFAVTLNGAAIPPYRAIDLRAGDILRIAGGTISHGSARGYLALAGGFDVPPVLGSRSTHVRSGIGGVDGAALRKDTRLGLRAPQAGRGAPLALDPRLARHDPGPIRVLPGPQDDYFDSTGWDVLLSERWRMSPNSDRMGMRLEGPRIPQQRDYNIVSDGVPHGAVQVPGDGQPIIMLADRQSTGGYPKIATVISADLPRLGQLRPGDGLRFARVTIDEAELAARELADRIALLNKALQPAGILA